MIANSIYTIILVFMVDIGDYFKVNSEIHKINTRNKSNLHPTCQYTRREHIILGSYHIISFFIFL